MVTFSEILGNSWQGRCRHPSVLLRSAPTVSCSQFSPLRLYQLLLGVPTVRTEELQPTSRG